MAHKVIRLPEVISRTGLARSTIYLRIAHEQFPRPISLGGQAVGWIETEVEEWLEAQSLDRRGGAGGSFDDEDLLV